MASSQADRRVDGMTNEMRPVWGGEWDGGGGVWKLDSVMDRKRQTRNIVFFFFLFKVAAAV